MFQIMGQRELRECKKPTAQFFNPCMQCAGIFFLEVRIFNGSFVWEFMDTNTHVGLVQFF